MNSNVMQRGRASYILLAVVIVACSTSGLINLLSIGGFYVATVVIDLSCILMAAIVLLNILTRSIATLPAWICALALLGIVYLVLASASPETLGLQFAEFRTRVLYLAPAVFAFHAIRGRREFDRAIVLLVLTGIVPACIGITQFVLRGQLPFWLVSAPGEQLFGYVGTDISRANGLVGNTIVYGGFMLLLFSICVFKVAGVARRQWLIALAIFSVAIAVSFSRIAIVSALVICATAAVYRFRQMKRLSPSPAVSILVAAIVAAGAAIEMFTGVIYEWWSNSFYATGLFNAANESALGSTLVHFDQIGYAIDAFQRSPLIGVGVATQRGDSGWSATHPFITDGAVWILAAEGGAVLLTATALLAASLVVAIWRACRRLPDGIGWFGWAMVSYLAMQFAFASWLNSAVFGKAVLVPTAICLGMLLGLASRPSSSDWAAYGSLEKIRSGSMRRTH